MSYSRVRNSSFSSRSISSSVGSLSLRGVGGMHIIGGEQARIVTMGPPFGRPPSVYGGAGGSGTRISQSAITYDFGSGSLVAPSDISVVSNEKGTMQNLNDRLATYLDKVRSLEDANRKQELQIREFYEKRTTHTRDFTGYFATILELQDKIARRRLENQSVILQIDNAQLAAEDFKMKFEMEMNMHAMVEADVSRLRGVRDTLTLNISDLEMQIEGLKEELAYVKSNHEEEMHMLRQQHTGAVSVEVESTESMDLQKVLQEIREQYENLVTKNNREIEQWFQLKMDGLQVAICTASTEVKTFNTELSELKRTFQSLEIARDSTVTEIQCLQQNVKEANSRYSIELNQLQMTINVLEVELQQLRTSIEQQKSEYNLLLDLKMRLELEIAEYRRLLEGECHEKKAVVISKVTEEVEEHKSHIERRVKTIVEEIVDGEVVSSQVDTKVEVLQ